MNSFPDRRYFNRIANESGFRAEPLETVFRLAQLLGQIDERFSDDLCLRGGTALNLLYLEIPRLSVDLDLDFVGSPDATQARERRRDLLDALASMAGSVGYEVAQQRSSYAMAHLILRYVDAAGRAAFVKFDVNFLDRVPVLHPIRIALRHPFGDDLPQPMVQTHALPELAAGKIIALVRRSLARDLFDVAMLSELPDLDQESLRISLVVRGAGYPAPAPSEYSPTVVDKIRAARWRSEVLALVRRPISLELEIAKTKASEFIRQTIRLESSHHEFLRLLDRGELRPELLTSSETKDRIAVNPALLWRLRVGAGSLEER